MAAEGLGPVIGPAVVLMGAAVIAVPLFRRLGLGSVLGYFAAGALAKAKYQHAAEPLEFDAQDDVTSVRARVTGQFPGSPATLTFAFRLAGDQIAALEIGA